MKRKKNDPYEPSEKQFKALIENAQDGIVLYDSQGVIRYASPSLKNIFGYIPVEVIGKKGKKFLHKEDVDQAKKVFDGLLKKPGRTISVTQRIRKKKGGYIWSESKLTNFLHVPEINGIVANFRDITEKKLAEERAIEAQELLETVARNITEGVFMGIVGERFLYVNDNFLKLTGYKAIRDIQKIKPGALYADPKKRKEILQALREKTSLKGVETQFRKKNGEKFWVLMNVNLLRHEGKENYFVGTIRDITKEKEAERRLFESRNFLNNIINTVAAPIFVKDHRHRWVMFNEQFSNLIGRKQEELLGKTDKDFLPPDEARVFWRIDNAVLKTGETVVNEEVITSGKGSKHILLTVKSRYVNEKGERFIIGFITNITDLKHTEDRIKQLHANFEGILESAQESIFAVDQEYRYTAFNRHHKKVMQLLFDADIKIGESKMRYLKNHPDAKWLKAELSQALEGHYFTSQHYQTFSSHNAYIQLNYNPIRDELGKVKGVAVFVRDITDRKRFEDIIKSINANLRAVVESTEDEILALDTHFRYLIFNQSHARNRKKLFKKSIRVGDNFLEIFPKEKAEAVKKLYADAFTGKRYSVETEMENNIFHETSFNPIFDEKGKVTGAALFTRDTTERKRMEERLKALNQELTEQNWQLAAQEEELKATLEELSEKNFELDQLMYKTSHDLRSPLSSIMGLINLAHLDPDPANYQQYLKKIEGRVKKLDEFINSMLNYARVNRMEVINEKVDIEAVFKSVIQELEYLENFHKVETSIRKTSEICMFRGDSLRMKIIFSNIISNAYKYYNPEVESYIHVTVDCNEESVKIIFEDNGIGIKKEHLNKIFDMFYRATDRSQGSGLGMYIVKQAVETLDGTISLESVYGKGTRITISLPNMKS